MICRIATFEEKPERDYAGIQAFRAWMKEQPGFRAAYHVHDPQTGKAMSISFWSSVEDLLAMRDRTPPPGPMGTKPISVEIFAVVEEF